MGIMLDENEFTSKSTSPKLIGETFTTLRTGIIDGAVEQDGSQYNFSDFPEIETLLKNGDLPYITIDEFDEMVTNQGGCDSFGYNEINLYAWTNFYTGTKYTKRLDFVDGEEVQLYNADMSEYKSTATIKYVASTDKINIDPFEPVSSVNLSRYSEEDILSSSFKVPKKVGRVLVRCQKPTSTNEYTWYNLYSDGWVEQGGKFAAMNTRSLVISLPVPMASSVYSIIGTGNEYSNSSGHFAPKSATTTSFTADVGTDNGNGGWWQVSGYANSTEYTRDKWNYQNVNYERHMIQLK